MENTKTIGWPYIFYNYYNIIVIASWSRVFHLTRVLRWTVEKMIHRRTRDSYLYAIIVYRDLGKITQIYDF